MLSLASWSLFADLPAASPANRGALVLCGSGAAGLALLLLVLRLRRGKKRFDPESGLGEDLSTFPLPPKGRRHFQLLVLGQRVRLRLVVVAPVGKRPIDKVDSLLEQVFRGLGEVSIDDHPRVRVWPPQLSTTGFAPMFFRLTKRPEPEGKPSRWILLAGPARAGATPVLLGLAVLADAPSMEGLVTLDESEWRQALRVENA